MEALNAAGLTPISAVLSDRKQEPRKNPSTICQIPQQKASNTSSKRIQGGLLVLSSVLSTTGLVAKALTYEEALQQATGVSSSFSGGDGGIDFSGVLDNPVLLIGGVAILVVPLVVSQLFKKPKPWGVESARSAYAKLGEDSSAELVDIRPSAELRKVGSPNLKGLGKKPVGIIYKGEDKTGFLKKLALKFKDPGNTTLFILDKFDGNSELVAELVTVNGFKAAYGIKDGAEGPRGWLNSNLPWIAPRKTLSLDLSGLAESLIGDGADGLSVALGFVVATGLGALVFTEVETLLQVLGSAAIVQVVTKNLLFAEDRKRTLKQVDEFLTAKIAPAELVDDVKEIGKALLPTVTEKALPVPAEAASESPSTPERKIEETIPEPNAEAIPEPKTEAIPEPKTEAIPEPKTEAIPEPKTEAIAEPAKEVNSTPPTEQPKPRPTYSSPYYAYPDFKPPTSPSPSKP